MWQNRPINVAFLARINRSERMRINCDKNVRFFVYMVSRRTNYYVCSEQRICQLGVKETNDHQLIVSERSVL